MKRSLRKRGEVFYADFFVDGQRFRQTLETTDWREAKAKEKELIANAKAGKISCKKVLVAKLPFRDAVDRFIKDRAERLTPLSVRTERERAAAINQSLGDAQVCHLTPQMVIDYIHERKDSGISNATVNRELDVIRGVLKKAKRWHLFTDEIHPLPIRHTLGRAMKPQEKAHLLKLAASREDWQNAAFAAVLALNTTMRGCEIKQLRWRDVDFKEKTLVIRKSKTEAGERMIPLNTDAWDVVLLLLKRARTMGHVRLDHCLFPACEASHFDPTRPITGWRTAWRNMTRAIECPNCGKLQNPCDHCCNSECNADIKEIKSPLHGLRFHDLRHHAITELAESQTSDSTIMAIAGHVSQKMLQHYSHVRLEAKRTALDALARRTEKGAVLQEHEDSYVTKSVTNEGSERGGESQVVERLVELVGIEPTTSSLRTMRSPS